jgi:hypothetical protein
MKKKIPYTIAHTAQQSVIIVLIMMTLIIIWGILQGEHCIKIWGHKYFW